MTTVKIDLPDQQAAALKAIAAKHGLTLEGWFQKMANQEARRPGLNELVQQGDIQASLSDEDRQWLETPPEQRGSVVEEMRKLRARVKPDPEGWTTRDYVNFGRR